MRRTMTALALVLALLWGGVARAQFVVPPRPAGAAPCTAANYAAIEALTAPADGTMCRALDDDLVYRYSVPSGHWLKPWMDPAALIVDYTGADTPDNETPAWTAAGSESAAVSAGILTMTDASAVAGHYISYSLADASILASVNSTLVVRARVTAQSADTSSAGYKVMIGLNVATYGCGVALAGKGAVSAANNFWPFASSGSELGIENQPYSDPDNAAWATYYVTYNKDAQNFCIGVIGEKTERCVARTSFSSGANIPEGGVRIGPFSSSFTGTMEVDWMQVFIH